MDPLRIPQAYSIGDLATQLERARLDRFHGDVVRAFREVEELLGEVGGTINLTGTQGQSPDDLPSQTGINAWDDEFEGSAIDTTGSRRSGAKAWTWFNQGSSTSTQGRGRQVLEHPGSVGDNVSALLQEAPTAPWVFRAKVLISGTGSAGNYARAGIVALNNANGHYYIGGQVSSGGHFIASYYADNWTASHILGGQLPWSIYVPAYIELEDDGTDFIVRGSGSGVDGTFRVLATDSSYSSLGAAPTHVGLCAGNSVSNAYVQGCFEWWRRIS